MSEEMEKLRAERDQLRAQVAQMKEALEAYAAAYCGDEAQDYQDGKWLFDKATKALSTPAPEMVPTDKARVLAEALAYIDAREEIGYVSYCGMTNNRIRVEEALAIARELGLLEEKR